jgi:filamentous hemagglutinin family protein
MIDHRFEYPPFHYHTWPALNTLVACIRLALAGAVIGGTSGETLGGELPIPKAVFATMGRADHAIVGNSLRITQHSDRSVLNWQSFNVGKDHAVRFVQPSASSTALNRIDQGDPSQIFGKVTANGQIYLINQNGFVFGRGSSINANSLVVSSLDITDETFNRGFTKVVDQDGRESLIGSGEIFQKDAAGHLLTDANGNPLKVKIAIEDGASIQAAKTGRLIFAAPSIENRGELSAPEGQIIMAAAGDKVYLQEAGADSKLRGLLVEVSSGGEVTNLGKLLAEHGNITLVGFAVNQQGRVSATTSVRTAGSVRLLAREGAATRREGEGWVLEATTTKRTADRGDGLGVDASLSLGTGSVTEATPDLNDLAKAVDGQTQDHSWIEVMGRKVSLQKGASLISRSGEVTVTATENPAQPGLANAKKNESRVYIDEGAVIDVSGVKNVSVPMERNVVELELRSNELRDAPLQRDGVLYAQTVRVDSRKGTPIADILGALERIERTVAERSAMGGALKLISEGDAIVRGRSLLDFSGGWVSYQSGFINTTQLIAEGKLYDIGDADPHRLYDGILGEVEKSYARWNTTRTWTVPGAAQVGHFEEGYIDGKPSGELSIQANSLILDGELRGQSVSGTHQRAASQQVAGGKMTVELNRAPDSSLQSLVLQARKLDSPLGPNDPFPSDPEQPDQSSALVLTPDFFQRSGIMTASIKTAGTVHLQPGERIEVQPGGSLALSGGAVQIDGTIHAPAGKVSLTAKVPTALAGSTTVLPSGAVDLGDGAAILADGLWSNERAGKNADPDLSPVFIKGGSVAITAQGDVNLAAGSRIDVSGSGQHQANGKVVAGSAGTISLVAANDLGGQGSKLTLDGELSGYALSGGQSGTLSLTSSEVILGEGGSPVDPERDAPQPLILNPEFFRRGGFGRYNIESNKQGVTLQEGTELILHVPNRVLDGSYIEQPSGSDVAAFSHIELRPETSRPAGEISLSLGQKVGLGTADAAVKIEPGAVIRTDAGGKVRLTSDTRIIMEGRLDAPAGEVALHLTTPVGSSEPGFLDNQAIWIGEDATVRATGQALVAADAIGHLEGEVKPGGQILLQADRGFVVVDPGAKLDVSGTAAELDLPVKALHEGGILRVRQTVSSSGGSIDIRAAEGIFLQGKLAAQRGEGLGAAGGSLSLELNPRTRAEPPELAPGQRPFPIDPSIIEVAESSGQEQPALPTGTAIPADLFGRAFLDSQAVVQGGFAEVKLRTPDQMVFQGDVSLEVAKSIELDAPSLVSNAGQGTVSLISPYVALGSTQTRIDDADPRPGVIRTPVGGEARFEVQANLIDLVGMTTLSGMGKASLYSSGDIRLIGVRTSQLQRDFIGQLTVSGHLDIQADQVYPTTLTDFRMAIENKNDGLLRILPGEEAGPVWSAAGRLTLEAPTIWQAGTVKAPQGELLLEATNSLWLVPGSVTSNALQGAIVPFGRTQGGLDWLYPLGGQNLVYAPQPENDTLPPPEKKMVLSAPNVQLAKGAMVDTSGGGDLFAFEFVPGPGGSVDILDPQDPKYLDGSFVYQQNFAVIPSFSSDYAPYEPLEYPTAGLSVGDRVYWSGGGGLKTGTYTLLPAHYALLPGAFLVTPEAGTTDLLPEQTMRTLSGDPIVAGYRTVAGTKIRDSRWSGFSIESQDVVKTRAEYTESFANRFFSERARQQEKTIPLLPEDAGQIRFSVESDLALEGRVLALPDQNGRGGRLDIEADRLVVLAGENSDRSVVGAVNLVADDLNRLGVASIALGGKRESSTEAGTPIDTRASTITLAPGAELLGPEFLLTAKDSVTLEEGAKITATMAMPEDQTSATTAQESLLLSGDSAFLRVSSGAQAEFSRNNAVGKTGSISIHSGAILAADGSMMMDSTLDTQLQGSIQMEGGSILLGASRISLGQVTTVPGGLLLTPEVLQTLRVDELALNSRSSLDLHAGVDLNLQRLLVRAAGVLGFNGVDQTARIRADSILFENTGLAESHDRANGKGAVEFTARRIEFGPGTYGFQGFSKVDFTASEQLFGTGTGNLFFAANLNLKTPVFSAGQGGNTLLDATGYQVTLSDGGGIPEAALEDHLGARLAVIGDRLTSNGKIRLPTGVIKLTSLNDDLILGAGTELDVSGRQLQFGNTSLATDGGQIDLEARQGQVMVQEKATLDLQGHQGGRLVVAAPAGSVVFGGSIDAHGAVTPGRFDLDVDSLGASGSLGKLGSMLQASGFGDSIRIQVRSGDLALSAEDSLLAHSLDLSAEQGSMTVEGKLTAEGAGATIRLNAGDSLNLGAKARLAARGTSESAGQVSLVAVDGDSDGVGQLVIEPGTKIDVSADDGSANGTIALRVVRTDSAIASDRRVADGGVQALVERSDPDVAVVGYLKNVVVGAREVTLEAVKTYLHEGSIGADDIDAWKTDIAAFMTRADVLEKRLGIPGGLRPGLTVRSPGDLVLNAEGWDLLDWRYEDRPGVLTLAASGTLTLQGSLSDGFKSYDENGIDLSDLLGAGSVLPVMDLLQTGNSWSYRLESGGDVVVDRGVAVRTGTGDITIAAGRDFVLTDDHSAVYTAGKASDMQRYGSFKNGFIAYTFYGEYPTDGGSIDISSGRDIQGAPTGQFFDGWFVRTGDWSRNPNHQGETPTSWAVALGQPDTLFEGQPLEYGVFAENIGALGGGNVTVRAGRDVTDLSVMLPTTGQQRGQQSRPDEADNTDFDSNQVEILGGGNLSVSAGGDVLGGTFYVARGTGTINAAGSIRGQVTDAGQGVGPVLALGDAQYRLQAGQGIFLGAAFNPTVAQTPENTNFFFTYSDQSSIRLTALSGNIEIQNDLNNVVDSANSLRAEDNQLNFNNTTLAALQIYPASFNATALQGNIQLSRSLTTYPAPSGQFELLAGQNIVTGALGANVNISQSDADPSLLPNISFPSAENFDDAAQRLDPFGQADLTHAKLPLHVEDSKPVRLYAFQGGFLPKDPLLFNLSKQVEILAGTDLKDVSFNIQHPSDAISTIDLGGNLTFTSPRNSQGNLINLTRQIQVSGPGQLWVTAGGSIDLGASEGIFTIGNSFNSALAEQGASLNILAGMKRTPDYEGFAKAYDPTSESYREDLMNYVKTLTGHEELDDTAAIAAYLGLTEVQQRELLLRIFFKELRASASTAALSGLKSDYDAGFKAIETLFPGQGAADNPSYLGDLKLFFSKIHTVDGGDINLLVPGGSVNAGLAVSFSGEKPASDLGIVVQREGSLNAFVDGDFEVNQSRVFAMDGGDIAIWSSNGDIDAGRGAKAALAVPPPIISFDEQGNLQIIFPPVVSGSGIRTAASTSGIIPGDVFLAAPRGVVDAGEAGIGGNNIVIAATAVIGASNIDVGGSSAGVPTTNVSVPVGSVGAAAAAASAAQTAQQSVSSSNEKATSDRQDLSSKTQILNMINVEVIGFGECSLSDVREGKAGCS